ncbi:MAG: hypothetical protein L3K26_08805 [Candidatus Hydrogenedentes bacterium]|nr:hypothetical protein [Candidatus Hydrogenedentota bacterium]
MRTMLGILLTMAVVPAVVAQDAETSTELRREDLGRTVKFTCVVDKVMQAHKGWVVEEWMIREAAEAGFNIYSPRIGYDNLDAVKQVTAWCDEYGIFHLPWMRGTLAASLDDPKAEGKRVVWASGSEQPLWSPNSDELWEWMARYIVAYAKMSAENEHLLGVFLDYENYAPGQRGGNLYSLSYDQDIMNRFAASEGIDLPDLAPKDRAPWLREQQFHDPFEAFQVAEWHRRCRTLREAVDNYDPAFQFWLYPVPGTPFLQEAAYRELGTKQSPIVIADQTTYGRPSEFTPEPLSIAANREKLKKYLEIPRAMNIPFLYAGGIDPVVHGADPEFCGKNAVAISDLTDGYWIFYEGPKYEDTHKDYWKWFTWANTAIAEGRFDAQYAPRKTEEGFIAALSRGIGTPGFASADAIGKAIDLPLQKLRGASLLLLACKKGVAVTMTVQDIPLGRYTDPLHWELRGPAYGVIQNGDVDHDDSGLVQFTPEADGVYFLGLSSGACSYGITRSNVPIAVYAKRGVGTIQGAKRLYFQVPEDTESFTIQLQGSGGETVRANVCDPEGKLVATTQTTLSSSLATLPVENASKSGGVWSLSLVKADEGVLEDARIQIEGIPPLLSLDPSHVFRPGSDQAK